MKLVLNDKEIIAFLIDYFCKKKSFYEIPECNFFLSRNYAIYQKEMVIYEKTRHAKKYNRDKTLRSTQKELHKLVEADLQNWKRSVEDLVYSRKNKYENLIRSNLEKIINKIGEENIFIEYKKSKSQNFVKSVGLKLDNQGIFIRRKDFSNVEENCLLRNTTGNENILLNKIEKKYPFWFIDSGYTNFIESNKKWHRLVHNHLHYGKYFDAPVDRLKNFKTFPKPWRESGNKILVIEPGSFSANIFQVDMKTWKYKIEEEIRKYSDRPIVFREKAPKKTRQNLYEHLLEEDYYCVININSNAATEAVWAGIPVITLDKHITNPISTNCISEINSLKRPALGNWLATLSYCQFTLDELVNGYAVKVVKKYHE